jgi:hypothetical protein
MRSLEMTFAEVNNLQLHCAEPETMDAYLRMKDISFPYRSVKEPHYFASL